MSYSDTIGDMVRLKTIAKAAEACGWSVRFLMKNDDRDENAADPAARPSNGRASRIKRFLPTQAWITAKDLAYLKSNRSFSESLGHANAPPDLIIDYNTYLNRSALDFAKDRGVPVVSNLEALPWDSMENLDRSFLAGYGRRFEVRKYSGVDAVWAVSAPLAERVRELATAQPNVFVLPNVYDAPRHGSLSQPSLSIPAGAVVVGFVGGVSKWPCLDRLGDACHALIRQGHKLHLVIVGDGPERRTLESRYASLGDGWYTFTGLAPRVQVPGYIDLFDVAVIPNHKWWTSPLKLLEYGALGKAVVAPDLPSITSMVEPDEVALFRHEDWEHFQEQLAELAGRAETRQAMGRRLAERVRSTHSFHAMQDTFRSLVEVLGPIVGSGSTA